MASVYLYSTLGCHLCEQAKVILWPLLGQFQFKLIEVDIAESDKLIQSYGVRIPVVGAPDSAEELSWPFTAEDVDKFFAKLTKS